MGTTCLHRAREFANKIQKAKIEPFIDNNFVQVEFLSRAASPRRLELVTDNVDLILILKQQKSGIGFGAFGFVTNIWRDGRIVQVVNTDKIHILNFANNNKPTYALMPVKLTKDFVIEMAYLPKTNINVRLNIPLTNGHQVSIDLNSTANGGEQSGLSCIDNKELPPGFRVRDEGVGMKDEG